METKDYEISTIEVQMRKVLEENEYMQLLGIELLEYKAGYAKGRMKYCSKVTNPYGSVHGGGLYSLADVISGTAACSCGHYVSTVNGNMNFIRPAMNTEYVYCIATQVRQGSHLIVYDVVMQDDKGVVLENGSFTFFLLEQVVCGGR